MPDRLGHGEDSRRPPFPLKQNPPRITWHEFGHECRASHVHSGAFGIVPADRFLGLYPQRSISAASPVTWTTLGTTKAADPTQRQKLPRHYATLMARRDCM